MKVMLIEDVVTLGRVGDLVEVKPGYGRNYLIPQGLAVLATKGAVKQAELLRAAAEKRRARDLENAQDFANQLAALTLRFERKVGEKARLYGSVTSADIAEQIDEKLELLEELDKRKVGLEEPIKSLGDYEIPVHIHPDVAARVRITVVGEEGETLADFEDELAGEEPHPDEVGDLDLYDTTPGYEAVDYGEADDEETSLDDDDESQPQADY